MQPQVPEPIRTQGVESGGLFGTAVMHWVFLAIVVILLLTAIFLLLRRRSRRAHTGEAELPGNSPEIHSEDL